MSKAFKAVKSIFSPPKPVVPPTPVVPTRVNSAAEISAAAEEDKQRRAAQAGRASTLLSGRTSGVLGDDSTSLGTRLLTGKK